ncbi:MAG: SUMF1/EgtB/PvdO family nonheme iron enzyme, partial [Desulfobacteraceae bacterium]|nr:SUMF1/EgtB/PvdO family nonheme iron enzyme [Desulfobacteraceae bacterium]
MRSSKLSGILSLALTASLCAMVSVQSIRADGGTWQVLWPSAGISGESGSKSGIASPTAIAISSHNPDRLYWGGGERQALVSENGGESFHALPESPEPMAGTGIADKYNEMLLFFATSEGPLAPNSGDGAVLRSDDGGESWEYIGGTEQGLASPNGLGRGAFADMLIQYAKIGSGTASVQRNLYVAKYSGGGPEGKGDGVYLLRDGHSQWEQVFGRSGARSMAGRDDFRFLYVGVDQDGVYKLISPDAPGNASGKWLSRRIVAAGSKAGGNSVGEYFYKMETGPDSGLVYVASDTGLFVIDTNDKPVPLRTFKSNAKASSEPGTLLQISPVKEDTMYLSSPSTGMEKSEDRGKTWKRISTDLDVKAISSLRIDPLRDIVYAASSDKRLWKRQSTAEVARAAALVSKSLAAGTSGQITNSIGMTLAPIPAGTFTMGSSNISGSKPVHRVTIASPFYMSAHEVTNKQYELFNPQHKRNGKNPDDDSPVNTIKYSEAVAFCQWLTEQEASTTGLVYRLPHEIEWEYAAHGGNNFPYPNTDPNNLPSGMTLSQAVRLEANSYGTAGPDVWEGCSPVGSLAPNGYGLYDMIGNVKEWCLNKSYTYPSAAEAHDPYKPGNVGESKYHMMRGNSYLTGDMPSLTLYYRIQYGNNDVSPKVGIRVVALPSAPVTQELKAKASATPATADVDTAVSFAGSATGGTQPYAYSWNFGDGITSSLECPAHAFKTAGTHTATLTVTDAANATSTASVCIPVREEQAPPAGQVTATFMVASGNDDAHEKSSTGVVLGSATLNMGFGFIDGFRFANVTIPKGAKILSAKISSAAEGTDKLKALCVTYWGEASDNALCFGTS